VARIQQLGLVNAYKQSEEDNVRKKSQGNPNVQENKKKYRKSNQFGKSEH